MFVKPQRALPANYIKRFSLGEESESNYSLPPVISVSAPDKKKKRETRRNTIETVSNGVDNEAYVPNVKVKDHNCEDENSD